MTARQRGQSSTIKMVNNGSGSTNSVEFVGMEQQKQVLPQTKSSIKGATNNPFSLGDNMEYVGYATFNGTEVESQAIQQQQSSSEDFTLQFDVALQPVDGQYKYNWQECCAFQAQRVFVPVSARHSVHGYANSAFQALHTISTGLSALKF